MYFTINRIGPSGDRQLRAEALTSDEALENIRSALEYLKMFPKGTKLEICCTRSEESKSADAPADEICGAAVDFQ